MHRKSIWIAATLELAETRLVELYNAIAPRAELENGSNRFADQDAVVAQVREALKRIRNDS